MKSIETSRTLLLLSLGALATGCREPQAAPPPVTTSAPAAQPTSVPTPIAAPAPPPTAAAPTADPPPHIGPVELPSDSWLRVERLEDDAVGGWVNGHAPTRNRIVLETYRVTQFSMDTARLDLDWSGRVWVRINRDAFELTHKPNPVIHFRMMSNGGWERIKPDQE